MDSLNTLLAASPHLQAESFRLSYDSLALALSALQAEDSWFKPTNIIAVATWMTALLSMVVAGAAVWIAYKQGQATTLPFLVLRKELGESEDGMGIYVQNKGPGPAIINSYTVFVPEAVAVEDVPRSENPYYSQLKSYFQGNFEYTIPEPDHALVPEEKLWLFRFPKGHTNPIVDTKRNFMDSTKIEIWYRGIQGQDGRAILTPSPRFGTRGWRVLKQPL